MGTMVTNAEVMAHGGFETPEARHVNRQGTFALFLDDLMEDLLQRPLQARSEATHDLFREHINALAISYFALIVILIAASVPILPYIISR